MNNNSRLKAFLKSPEFCMLVLVIISILIVWSSLAGGEDVHDKKTVPSVTEMSASESTTAEPTTSAASAVTTASTTSASTTTENVTTTDEISTSETSDDSSEEQQNNASESSASTANGSGHSTVTTAAKPQEQLSPYVNAGYSPNSEFYQQRLSIAGDSIAYGFNAYGYIPYEHNYAQESVSMWNLNGFTFCGGYGLAEAVCYNQPSLLYMSIGMNDVNMNSPEIYASQYVSVINDIRSGSPDTVIVVAGISPIGWESSYTTNDNIRAYNSALQTAVEGLDSKYVYYFDAYSVLCDEYLNLRSDCSGGDGLHLQSHCYEDLLTALFNYLDTTPVKSLLQ